MKRLIYIVMLLLAVSLTEACRKDPVAGAVEGEKFKTTPYTLYAPYKFPLAKIPADNPMTVEGVALGRKLFFDPILSKTYTQSCAGCHNPQFGFSDGGKQFSVGVDGKSGDKNAMAIFNLAYRTDSAHAGGFFWDGRSATLEAQSLQPIQNPVEMHMTLAQVISRLNQHPEYRAKFKQAFNVDSISPRELSFALAQFMRSIQSYSSPFDKNKMSESAKRGFAFFQKIATSADPMAGDCIHCHQAQGTFDAFANKEFLNNGLDASPEAGRFAVTGNPNDRGKFKVPSLRNLLLTAPYMHDGRFKTLEEVVNFYDTGFHASPTLDPNLGNHLVGGKPVSRMTAQDKADLVEFLKSLTDTLFIYKPEYTQP